MKWFAMSAGLALALSAPTSAEDKKAEGPVTLRLIAKTDKYKFDGGGKTPAEYKKSLEEIKAAEKQGKLARPPAPPAVDLVLQLTNASKEEVTVYVGGDSNVYTFELAGGAGVVTMGSGLAFTTDFRIPKAVTLAPGKSYDIPVKRLSDGSRGAARNVYWTGPGEYKLSATYTLADPNGGKGATLKSEPVKITVTEK
jgi:hypothetical protein